MSTRAGTELEMDVAMEMTVAMPVGGPTPAPTATQFFDFALTLQQTANEHNDSCIACVFHVYRIICNPLRNNNQGGYYDDDDDDIRCSGNGNP